METDASGQHAAPSRTQICASLLTGFQDRRPAESRSLFRFLSLSLSHTQTPFISLSPLSLSLFLSLSLLSSKKHHRIEGLLLDNFMKTFISPFVFRISRPEYPNHRHSVTRNHTENRWSLHASCRDMRTDPMLFAISI